MSPSADRASTGFARAEQTTRGRRRFWTGVFSGDFGVILGSLYCEIGGYKKHKRVQ